VECPAGAFFCLGWNECAPLNLLAVCVNPGSAFNYCWSMTLRKKCRLTMENLNDSEPLTPYYRSITPWPRCPLTPLISTPRTSRRHDGRYLPQQSEITSV